MFGAVTVGEKGQIVIPAKARKIFNIRPGDSLVVLGDITACRETPMASATCS